MRKLTVLLGLMAMVLAGCRVESRTILTVDEAGTGTVEARVLLDDEAAAFVGQQGDTPEDVARTLATSLGSQAAGYEGSARRMVVNELTGVAITFSELGPADVEEIVTDAGSVLESLTLTVDGSTLIVVGSAGPAPDQDTRRLVETAPANIRDLASLVLEVRLPGEVTSSNADRQSGDVLEWDLVDAILEPGSIEIRAESSVPEGFALTVDRGPDPSIVLDSVAADQPESSSAIVWVMPLVAGAVTWLLLARRRAQTSSAAPPGRNTSAE